MVQFMKDSKTNYSYQLVTRHKGNKTRANMYAQLQYTRLHDTHSKV